MPHDKKKKNKDETANHPAAASAARAKRPKAEVGERGEIQKVTGAQTLSNDRELQTHGRAFRLAFNF
jgi:hypothetical protein